MKPSVWMTLAVVGSVVIACGPPSGSTTPETDTTSNATATAAVTAAATAEASSTAGLETTATATATAKVTASATAKATAQAAKLKATSLKDQGLNLTLDIPEDAKLEKNTSKDKLGGANIDSSTIYLRVFKADARMATIAAAKATLQKLVRPAKSFSKEEADLLVYSTGDGELDFVHLAKVGGVTYVCQSRGSVTKEEELAAGIAACKTLRKE